MPSVPVSSHLSVVAAAAAQAVDTAPTLPPGGSAAADFSSLLALKLGPPAPVPPEARLTDSETAVTGVDERATGEAAAAAATPALPALPIVAAMFLVGAAPTRTAAASGESGPVGAAAGRGEVPPAPVAAPAEPGVANLAARLPDLPANAVASGNEAQAPVEIALPKGAEAAPGPSGPALPPLPLAWSAPMDGALRTGAPGTAASQAVPFTLHSPVGSPSWGAELGQSVLWLAGQERQLAQINVTPPQLGPLEIRLSLNQDQASMSFVSPHAPVREAIEAALPRLREMLADSGLTLANVDVSAQSFAHARHETGPGPGQGRSQAGPPGAAGLEALAGPRGVSGLRGGEGLVDVFA